MKMTLLDMTQNILSSLSSDEVNSISDTTESLQVANIIKTTYFNILTRAGLTNQMKLFQLQGSGDLTIPTVMYIPDTVTSVDWIKYYHITTDPDIQAYENVCFLTNEEFVNHVNQMRPSSDSHAVAWTFENSTGFDFNLVYMDDAQPRYYTVFENHYVVFDAYDADQDSTLQGSKTMCYGLTIPTWEDSDDFIPELDDYRFPLLLNEAKSLATVELHQTTNPKAEQEVKRQWNTLQKNKNYTHKPSAFEELPSFGRSRYSRLYMR